MDERFPMSLRDPFAEFIPSKARNLDRLRNLMISPAFIGLRTISLSTTMPGDSEGHQAKKSLLKISHAWVVRGFMNRHRTFV